MHVHPQALCESNQVGEGTRIWAFAHVMSGAVVGRDCNIGEGAFVEGGAVVGDRVTVKNQAMIWDGVHVGDDAFIGPGVTFTNDRRPRSPRSAVAEQRYRDVAKWRERTVVGRGATVGAGAVVLPGVTIGEYAMIGAGAVVTRDVAAQQVVVGNPARPAGWACVCGDSLDARLHCPSCGAWYTRAGQHLERAS